MSDRKPIKSARKNVVIYPEWPNYMRHSQRFNSLNSDGESQSPKRRHCNFNYKHGISIDNPLSNPYCSVFKNSKSILGDCASEFSKQSEAGLSVSNEVHRAYFLNGQPKIFTNTIENGIAKQVSERDKQENEMKMLKRLLALKSKREQQ